MVFNRSDALSYGGAISGAGTIAQIGSGITTLGGDSSTFSGSTSVTNGTLEVNGALGNASSTMTVSNGGALKGNGTIGGNVAISDGILAPGNSPGTLTIGGDLSLTAASVLNYEFGQAGVVGGPLNDLTVVGGNLTLAGTLNVSTSAGGSFGPGLYRVISYGGTLTDNGLVLGTQPAGSMDLVQTAVAGQVNLINRAGLTLNFWDGATTPRNNGVVDGGTGVWQSSAGNDNWTNITGIINAPYADGTVAIFAGSPGTVTVDNSLGAVVSGGMQFATNGYVLQGQPITLAAGSNTLRVGDGTAPGAGYVATIATALTGLGGIDKTDLGTLILSGDNSYTGGTTISAGALQLGNGGTTGSILGDVTDNGTLAFDRSDDITYGTVISGTGAVTKLGSNTLTLTAASTYTGATTVAAGTLRAGAANMFDAASAHTVAPGATLDTAGFAQSVAGLTNSGTVNVAGATAGNTLTVSGAYVGNAGTLTLGTALAGNTSVSDQLVLNGPAASASGNTTLRITNLGGLGALTTGDGIQLVDAINGATSTAQTSKNAFSLSGGHVDAGAFEYRLYAADAQGAGENWYLRSTTTQAVQPPSPPSVPPSAPPPSQPTVQVPTYRVEVPLLAALPAQLRRADLAMLGNLQRRIGDEAPAGSTDAVDASEHRTWARVVYADVGATQPGIAQARADGSVSGLQVGTDLWVNDAWHAGVYLGYLNGSSDVTGNARGEIAPVGSDRLRAHYLGAYATWMDMSGWYVDGVLQGVSQRYDVRPNITRAVSGKGDGFMASVEAGKAYALVDRWSVEPQVQVAYQHNSIDDLMLSGARVQQEAASGWIARLGV
ncbi:outer membrane autotransporter protein, partial [Dyella japonica]